MDRSRCALWPAEWPLVLRLLACLLPARALAQDAEARWRAETGYDGPYVIIRPDGVAVPPFEFSATDEALLEEITAATFRWFWDSPNVTDSGLISDRGGSTISVAGVGFQLGALPIGVERGYITRAQGERRALRILSTLLEAPAIRKEGMFFHFVSGQPLARAGSTEISTIDTSLLYAGAMVAGGYFGGEVEQVTTEMIAGTDWNFFTLPASAPDWKEGLVSLSWDPSVASDPTGPGLLNPSAWDDAVGEDMIIYFIGAGSPDPQHRLDPSLYYRLRRPLGTWGGLGPMIRLDGAGGTFLHVFAQVWIDYAGIAAAQGPDRPDLRGEEYRAPADHWENSRRHALMHRGKAIAERPAGFATLGPNAWGLSASDGPSGYQVPGLQPAPLPIPGARVPDDVPGSFGGDEWLDGTVAIYGAGQMIMFTPAESVAALRHYRGLTAPGGGPLVWRDDYGFFDAYNAHVSSPPWVASTRLAIDQGPMLLAIENARSGLIWDCFHRHPVAAAAMERLGLEREEVRR